MTGATYGGPAGATYGGAAGGTYGFAFFPPTDLTATAQGPTEVLLEWTDPNDNESGTIIERREEFRSGFGDWRVVADINPDEGTGAVSYTDDHALPNTTYQYRAVAHTPGVRHASGSVETTTADDGVRTDRVPARGWHVIVEDTLGNIYTPDVVGEPSGGSRLNDLPRVEIPVARAERWSDSAEWERAPMRVYRDGERLPIEQIDTTRQETDRSVLVGVGGVELRERVAVDVIEEDAHLTAEGLLGDTSYAANVDDPAAATTADLLQQSADTETEWADVLTETAGPTDVFETTGTGVLRTRQTAYFVEAEDGQVSNGSEQIESSSDRWSGGRVVEYEQQGLNTYLDVTPTTDHEIPDGEVGIAIRTQQPGNGHYGFTVELDGVAVESVSADVLADGEDAPDWFVLSGDFGSALAAGEHTLRVQFDDSTATDDGRIYLDCVCLYDDRYDPGFTESVSDNTLEGPDLYPSGIQAQTVDAVSVRQVIGGRLETGINDTTGSQAVAISNDSGGTWIEASNSATVEGEFASGSTSIRARFTLGGFDSDPSTSPAGRTAPQAVDLYSLYADLEDTPLLANRSWDQTLLTILQDIASYGNFIFEVVWDSAAGSIAVEWTQAGQQTVSVDPTLVDYSVSTDYSSVHRRAVIYGTSIPRSTNDVVADPGTWQPLDDDWLLETGERVVDANSGTEYERSVDYELEPNAGRIRPLSTGDIDAGDGLDVSYDRRIRGTFESEDYTGDYPVYVDDVPAITTERNANAAALAIVQEASDPLVTASVTIDREPGISLVEAIDLEQLPVDEPLEVWSADNSPGQVSMQLGNREEISETVRQIQSRLGATSRKT